MAGRGAWLVSAMIVSAMMASVDAGDDMPEYSESKCSNEAERGEGEKVVLTLEAKTGNAYTDANGYCEFGHTGVDGHCIGKEQAFACTSGRFYETLNNRDNCRTFYVCKCLSPEEAAQMREAQKKQSMTTLGIIGGLLLVIGIGACVMYTKQANAPDLRPPEMKPIDQGGTAPVGEGQSSPSERARPTKYLACFMLFCSSLCIVGIIINALQGGEGYYTDCGVYDENGVKTGPTTRPG